jgi:hypothetical protein
MIDVSKKVFFKLCKYDIEVHNLGHFVHYYIRSRKTKKRIKVVDFKSQKCIDFLRSIECLREIKFHITEEVGGFMTRKSFRIFLGPLSFPLDDDVMSSVSIDPSFLLKDINILERDDMISLLIR